VYSAEQLKEMRRGTLQATALGVSYEPPHSFLVYFDSIPPNDEGAYSVIEVAQDGEARMLHTRFFASLWLKPRGASHN